MAACPGFSEPIELPFWRALSSRGDISSRTLTRLPLGINLIKCFTDNMKALLPPTLQWEGKATGKTARMTFTTLAVNNGVENLITAAATKHRDPKTMMGYVKPNVQTFTGAAIGIGSALKKQRRHVDGDDDGNTGMHFLANACSSSSFHTGSQDQGALSRFQQASSSGPPQPPTVPGNNFYGNVTIMYK